MPNGERGYTSKSTCFMMGGDIREAWRDSEIAIDDLADGREFEHVTTHLRHTVDFIMKLKRFAPHYGPSFDSFEQQIDDVIRMILAADDTAVNRQNLILHIQAIQQRMKRMGLALSRMCS